MSRERTLASPETPTPLLPWLLVALQPTNRTRVKQLLQRGRIRVNGAAITRHDHPVLPADRLTLADASATRADAIGLTILHEDDALIAVDKPCGLLSVASDSEKADTAFTRLAENLKLRAAGRPFVVHRLDRDTSGVLLFARTPELRDQLQEEWNSVEKTYFALVEGSPKEPAGTIENHLLEGKNLRVRIVKPGGDAKLATTHYRLIRSHGSNSLLEVNLGTGRKHQIRVHLASIGCPVVGDTVYGAKSNPVRRLGLHAWKLELRHPRTREPLAIEAPIPRVLSRG